MKNKTNTHPPSKDKEEKTMSNPQTIRFIPHIKPVPTKHEVALMSYWSDEDQTRLVQVLCSNCTVRYCELLSAVFRAIDALAYGRLLCIDCDPNADEEDTNGEN